MGGLVKGLRGSLFFVPLPFVIGGGVLAWALVTLDESLHQNAPTLAVAGSDAGARVYPVAGELFFASTNELVHALTTSSSCRTWSPISATRAIALLVLMALATAVVVFVATDLVHAAGAIEPYGRALYTPAKAAVAGQTMPSDNRLVAVP